MYAGTHDIIELDEERFLMAGSKKDAMVRRADGIETVTQYDYVVEWDSKENKGIKDWDLGEVLDIDRTVFSEDDSLNFKADWFHINSIAFDPTDNSVIASGRNQGVLKVDDANNLKWILAPHKGWGKSGRTGEGFETSEHLLTAIDADGNPYPDPIQNGSRGNEDFEWSTGQHALNILSNGNLLLFDNGLSRNFETAATYSRAVEYKIDEENMTIQQVWEYGTSRGLDMYSPITSDVDVMPITGNRLITAGNVRKGSLPPHSKMIEITYPDNKVVFEANIFLKDANGNGEQTWAQFDLAFAGDRLPLYKE
jgi:arylsulfate sulfotransferase